MIILRPPPPILVQCIRGRRSAPLRERAGEGKNSHRVRQALEFTRPPVHPRRDEAGRASRRRRSGTTYRSLRSTSAIAEFNNVMLTPRIWNAVYSVRFPPATDTTW